MEKTYKPEPKEMTITVNYSVTVDVIAKDYKEAFEAVSETIHCDHPGYKYASVR